MSSGVRNLPSFGISKKSKINNNNIDPAIAEVPVTMTVTNTGINREVNMAGVSPTSLPKNTTNLPPRSFRANNVATPAVPATVATANNVNNANTTSETVTTNNVSTHINSQVDLSKSGRLGEITFNNKDGLLYYYTGKEWASLAIMDHEMRHLTESLAEILNVKENNTVIIEAPPRGNIHLIAGNNPPGSGGHVLVSAGQGGLADGEIYFTVGGDKAMTINKNADVIINAANMHIDRGDLVVKAGNLEFEDPIASINCHIAKAEITSVIKSEPIIPNVDIIAEASSQSEILNSLKDPDLVQIKRTQTVPDVILNAMTSILTVNLNLDKCDELSGNIRNSLLRENSWVNVSAIAAAGSPYVWLGPPSDGEIAYTIRCMNGKLSRVQLHLEIRNCI